MEDSFAFLVGKETFMRTVGELLKKSNLSRIELLQRLPIFADWPLAQLASLYRNAVKKEFTYSSLVYSQEEVSESIFVILTGEIEVTLADLDSSFRAEACG